MLEQPDSSSESAAEPCCEDDHGLLQSEPAVLSASLAQRMAEFLGFLADANRLRIVSILATQEMCVGDLAQLLEMNDSAVSHQLRTLRAIRLVDYRKQGRHVFYRLQDQHVLSFYQAVVEHIEEAD
jgi:DNA-binding transcriptional ArsR family regulator